MQDRMRFENEVGALRSAGWGAVPESTQHVAAAPPKGAAVRAALINACQSELRYWRDGQLWEMYNRDPADDRAATERIRLYSTIATGSRLKLPDPKFMWSASFVSWIVSQAGLTRRNFKFSTAHRVYISACKGDTQTFAYRADDASAPLAVGDIVCKAGTHGITRNALGSIVSLSNVGDGTQWGLHCDIVIAVEAGSASIVGGNVGGPGRKSLKIPIGMEYKQKGGTVSRRTIQLTSRSAIDTEKVGQGGYFAVLKLRSNWSD
jgi:hypothetical protein